MASKIRRWLRELAVWLLIGAAVSLAVDYFRQPALPQNVSATSLQTLDGRTLDLHAISQQKPLLLYVWSSTCPICRAEEGTISALAEDWPVLTLAMQSGNAEAVAKFMQERKLAYPALVDVRGEIAWSLGVRATPA